jgi:hypothetical protein
VLITVEYWIEYLLETKNRAEYTCSFSKREPVYKGRSGLIAGWPYPPASSPFGARASRVSVLIVLHAGLSFACPEDRTRRSGLSPGGMERRCCHPAGPCTESWRRYGAPACARGDTDARLRRPCFACWRPRPVPCAQQAWLGCAHRPHTDCR